MLLKHYETRLVIIDFKAEQPTRVYSRRTKKLSMIHDAPTIDKTETIKMTMLWTWISDTSVGAAKAERGKTRLVSGASLILKLLGDHS